MSAIHRQAHWRARGFTLIELTAAVAMVALVGMVLLPIWSKTSSSSLAIHCMANHRQLVRAWHLYAVENDGKCVNNFPIPDMQTAVTSGRFNTWANNVMTWGASGGFQDAGNTNEVWLKRGLLTPYIANEDTSVYSCPADRFVSAVQRRRGWTKRVRSASMNAFFGGTSYEANLVNSRSWAFGGAYRQWLKVEEAPQPAMTWLTLDEHADSVNDGFFVNEVNAFAWSDLPAPYHGRGTTFSYLDGHAEIHKWRSKTSVYPVTFSYPPIRPLDAAGKKDMKWYTERVGLVRL